MNTFARCLFWVGISFLAAIIGGIGTAVGLGPWYQALNKPSWNPPSWIFGPVWTTLFALMAFAVWRVLRLPASTPGRQPALVLFYGQLILNALWSWAFFASQSPLLGLVDIGPQLIFIIATIIAFRRVDPLAAWCMVPLAGWVSFASILNFAIWRLN